MNLKPKPFNCPNCGQQQQFQMLYKEDVSKDYIILRFECYECNTRWTEHYKLEKKDDILTPDSPQYEEICGFCGHKLP